MISTEKQKLMMSKTFDLMHKVSTSVPCDVNNHSDLKGAFTACCQDLINALDNDRIVFELERDRLLVHGLLALAADYVLEGQLKNVFNKVTIN
jgi:hypothetical protein